MPHQTRTVERVLAGIASNSHGVVTRRELLHAGVTRDEILHRLRTGALLREYPGVYRVGHRAASVEARYLAAIRACGERALLSGLPAAHLLGLLKGPAPPPAVTAPTERRVNGVRTRRSDRICVEHATGWRGVPVTTVACTLVDLASSLGREELARACHEAGVRFRTTPAQVEAVLSRRSNARGSRKLRAVLHGEVRVTLSALERRFLKLLREARLPLPHTNRPAGGRRVTREFVRQGRRANWPDHRLTVELDSYRYHNSRHAWEQDRRREREAHASGDEMRRYTHDDVMDDPRQMLSELRRLLHTSKPA